MIHGQGYHQQAELAALVTESFLWKIGAHITKVISSFYSR